MSNTRKIVTIVTFILFLSAALFLIPEFKNENAFLGFMILGLFLFGGYWSISELKKWSKGGNNPKKDDPIVVLKHRLAKGEITKEEYQELKKELDK